MQDALPFPACGGDSVLEVIKACEQVTGRKVPRQTAARREGDAPALVADPAKLKKELGWAPLYADIRKTIETAWRWHKDHPKGYWAEG